MQVAQPADDEGGVVVEVPLTFGSMVGVGERDVAGVVQKTFQRDAAFGTGQRTARAGVRASAERDVLAGLVSFRNKLALVVVALFIGGMVFSTLAAKAW